MVRCESCGRRFHSARALRLENCPRCLLRDDVAARLVIESVADSLGSPGRRFGNISATPQPRRQGGEEGAAQGAPASAPPATFEPVDPQARSR